MKLRARLVMVLGLGLGLISSGCQGDAPTAAFDPVSIITASLPDALENAVYGSQTLAATGGDGSYLWSLATGSGPLPSGLNLATNGVVLGTPTVAGSFNFTARVTSAGLSAEKALTINVIATLELTTTSLPTAVSGEAYSATLAANGGAGGRTWTVTVGALPTGLTLNGSTGAITGTPGAVGNSAFTVRVTSADGQSATRQLAIDVYGPLQITTTSLPTGLTGSPYTATLAATGGSSGHTWAVTAGALPSGLSLAADGAITGTPSTAGSDSFTATVTSGDGQSDLAALTIDVYDPLQITSTTPLPSAVAGASYSETLTATGGDGIYSWTWTGALPTGMSLAANGAITGTPTVAGNSNFTVEVASGDGQTAQQALSITVTPGPPDPDQSSLAVDQTTMFADGVDATTVTVTVRDANDNVVPGVPVLLEVSGTGNTITQPAVTDAAGLAVGSFTTTVAEAKTVSATADGVGIIETQSVTAILPYALDFNDSWVTVPDHSDFALGATWAIEAWIKPSAVGGGRQDVVSKWGGCAEASFVLAVETGRIWTGLPSCSDGTQDFLSTSTLVNDQWQHIAVTLSAGFLRIFINGVEDVAIATTRSAPTTTTPLSFGREGPPFGGWRYAGLIDEARIWNVARTANDIAANRAVRLAGTEPGLVGYWRFDDGGGDVASDATGRGHDGQLGAQVGADANDPTWTTDAAPITQ